MFGIDPIDLPSEASLKTCLADEFVRPEVEEEELEVGGWIYTPLHITPNPPQVQPRLRSCW